MADEISKKRITEYTTEVTVDELDDSDVIFIDSTQHGTRKLRLKGVQDAITNIENECIKSSGVSVTKDNYATTITNVNNQPVNTIYAYAAGLQSSITNLPSNAALNILHYTYKYSTATNVGQVMIAIERSGDNPAMYFRSTSGSPVTWGSWVKMANNADVEAIREELDKKINADMFDIFASNTIQNGFIDTNGEYKSNSSWYIAYKIPTYGATQIKLSGWYSKLTTGGLNNVWAYDENGNSLGGIYGQSNSGSINETIDLPSGTAYISVCNTVSKRITPGYSAYLFPEIGRLDCAIKTLKDDTYNELDVVNTYEYQKHNGYIGEDGILVDMSDWTTVWMYPVNVNKIRVLGYFSPVSLGGQNNIWCYDEYKKSLGGCFSSTSGSKEYDEYVSLIEGTKYISICNGNSRISKCHIIINNQDEIANILSSNLIEKKTYYGKIWKSDEEGYICPVPVGTVITVKPISCGDNSVIGLNVYGMLASGQRLLDTVKFGSTFQLVTTEEYTKIQIATSPYKADTYFTFEFSQITYNHKLLDTVLPIIDGVCKIFRKVVCCGDSFTSGHIVDSDGTAHATNEDYAWPHYMEILTGNTWVNCGHSGANVITWQTMERGLPKAQASGKAQAYVIGLGINDGQSSTSRYVPVGTPSDIGTNNETYYGGMSKIIRSLADISPNAHIFVNTNPNIAYPDYDYTDYNNAIRYIVNEYKSTYKVHLIDLDALKEMYMISSIYKDITHGHMTALGYEQFATIYYKVLSNYIASNLSEFQDVAFSPADVKTVGDEISDIKADLNNFDLEYDSEVKRIFLTLNGTRKGEGVDISNLITDDDVDVSSLLIYFRSNVLDAIKYIKTMPKKSVSHVCATDIHYNSNKRHSAQICNLLMDTGLFDKFLILGDVTDDNTTAQYNNFISDGWAEHNGEIVFALGNHDIRTPSGGYPTYTDFYNDFLSKASYGNAETLYYIYSDYQHMIKYVVINTETITIAENDPQLQMIRNAVSDSDWTVFVLAHRNLGVLPEGITWAQSLGTGLTDAIKSAIESGSATVGGYICGHQHVDIFTPVDEKFYHVTLLNDRHEVQNYYDGYSVTSRPTGTVNEQAITIITIDPIKMWVDVYRIGAAYDKRNWRYYYAPKSGTLPEQPGVKTVSNDQLLNVNIDNRNHFVTPKDSYSAKLSAENGYELGSSQVLMGSTDVTDSVINGDEINIESVTGDVIISSYAHAKDENVIVWERIANASGNGAVTVGKETNHVTWETPGGTRTVSFAVNGVVPGQYYDVEFIPDTGYESDNGIKVNSNVKIDSSPIITNDPEITKPSIGMARRGIRVPNGHKTLKFALYRPGIFTVKKRNVIYGEELFKEANLDIYKHGDANYVFNDDGTLTITGTKPPTYNDSSTNAIYFILRNVIVNASYHVKITSSDKVVGSMGLLHRDYDTFEEGASPTIWGGRSFSNNTISVLNYDGHYVNNPGTSVLGRGSMYIKLTPAATYEASITLDDPATL